MDRASLRDTLRLILCWVILVIAGGAASAQPTSERMSPLMLGGGVSYVVGLQSAEVPVYGGEPTCGTFSEGSGSGISVDGRLVMPILFAPALGLDARLRLALSDAELAASPVVPTNIRDTETGALVTLEREYRIERSLVTVGLDLLARYDAGPVTASAGFALGVAASSEVTQSDNILGPGDHRFPDGQSSRTMASSGGEASSVAFQPLLALSVPIRLGAGMFLLPEVAARFGVGSSMSDATWTTTELTFGVAALFDIAGPSTPIAPAPGTGR